MGYGNSTAQKSLLGQGRVLLINYWLTYCVLKAKKPRFQQLRPPSAAPTAHQAEAPSKKLRHGAVQQSPNRGGNGSAPKHKAAGGN